MEHAHPILVVEEEPLIRLMISRALEDQGFSVLEVASGEEAFAVIEERGEVLNALVTDIKLVRSKVGGWEIARHVRQVNPDLPVVYIAEDSAGGWSVMGVPRSLVVVKPFSGPQIVAASHAYAAGRAEGWSPARNRTASKSRSK